MNTSLCTVTNEKFLLNSFNLIKSFFSFIPNGTAYLYVFGDDLPNDLDKNIPKGDVIITKIPKVCEYIYNPLVFLYKAYALKDCIDKCGGVLLYSDSTHCFIRDPSVIHDDIYEDFLFLPYTDPRLTNRLWTTKQCFNEMDALSALDKPQYWAGFQAYKKSEKTKSFLDSMYNFMLNPRIAFPDSSVRYPDGESSSCIEHRQDQSVLSLLIDKNQIHQPFCQEKNERYGDWQTIKLLNPMYVHNESKMILSPRESKQGFFRYLNH